MTKMLFNEKRPLFIVIWLLFSIPVVHAQEIWEQQDEGRWVTRGTFAKSALPANNLRERTYARSKYETQRVSSYLPGMTIVYHVSDQGQNDGYAKGVTQFGIPVQILESELSVGKFSDREWKDVVVHRQHLGCPELGCKEWKLFPIRAGETFRIVKKDDIEVVLESSDQYRVVYSTDDFDELERSGYLTLHKDRISPRWKIADGYANQLSQSCGDHLTDNMDLKVSLESYSEPPTSWTINDKRWNIKAIEIFDLGYVQTDEDKREVTGFLFEDLGALEGEPFALDLTVYAYNDRSWKNDTFQFAGLAQYVHCEPSEVSKKLKPQYVDRAIIFYDHRLVDNTAEEEQYLFWSLPQQFPDITKADLYQRIGRSFYYSLNNSKDYEKYFERVSEKISPPAAVANILARLNASCRETLRPTCSKIANAVPISEQEPSRKPVTN